VPIATLLFAVNVALIIHAAKTGRFSPWGYVLLFLPGIGAIAYILVELLPEWLGSYRGQVARQKIVRAVAPGRRYRELTDELALVDTIANRVALAQECLTLGKFDEALFHYTILQARPLADEPQYFFGKARAQFGLHQPAAAIATFDELMQRWPEFHSTDGHLLYAIALEEDGRSDDALANYANLAEYFPGPEPRVRQAQLLHKLGRETDAKALAEDVVRGLRRAPAHVRKNERHWLSVAQAIARG
jgi:hypothetical protein